MDSATRGRRLADNFPLDNFLAMELVQGEVVQSGTCPGGNCPPGTCLLTRHISQPCAWSAHRNPPTDIHSRNVGSFLSNTNICIYITKCQLSLLIGIRYILPTFGECESFGGLCIVYFYSIMMDINCQHLGIICQLSPQELVHMGTCPPGTCPEGSCHIWNLSGGKLSPQEFVHMGTCPGGTCLGGSCQGGNCLLAEGG